MEAVFLETCPNTKMPASEKPWKAEVKVADLVVATYAANRVALLRIHPLTRARVLAVR